jgi:hypothetical protein
MSLTIKFSERFVAERTYVFDVLLNELLGLRYTIQVQSGFDGYLIELPNGRHLRIRDHFFGRLPDSTDYIRVKSLPGGVERVAGVPFAPEPDSVVLFGRGTIAEEQGNLLCDIDVVATVFFMLTRWEEAIDGQPLDRHGRYPAASALAFRHSFLHRPIVNEYLEAVWSMLVHLGWQEPRRARRFEVVPTHDIDIIYYDRLRSLGYAAFKARSAAALAHAMRSLRADVAPFDTFDWLMDVSESTSVRSRFNLMGGGTSPVYDRGRYALTDALLQHIVRNVLARKHILGFHPSYSAHLDFAQWMSERDAITCAFGVTPTEGRHHYLRFRVPDTWRMWDAAGMSLDSTAGYADAEGFRCGTGDPFSAFDVRNRKALRLRELPLIIMDGTLAAYRKVPAGETLTVFRHYIDLAVRYRMPLTILFHNNSFDEVRWPGWRKTYQAIFDEIRGKERLP